MSTRQLTAGLLSATLDNGSLRDIRFGSEEIVRHVYFAVRDEHWNTIPPIVLSESVEQTASGFEVRSELAYRSGEIDFTCVTSVRADGAGGISWVAEGEARRSFRKNRIGYCVLHPIEGCAGRPCAVMHSDGALERGHFPLFISPHQPFFDIAAITHEVAPGIECSIAFEGDVFEMEDHRNWTDQSFKTYSTPLSIPYPAVMQAGAKLRQRICLELRRAAARTVEIALDRSAAFPVPEIGLPADQYSRDCAHYLHTDWVARDRIPADVPVELALTSAVPRAEVKTLAGNVVRVLVFDPEMAPALSGQLTATLAGGANTNFAELNRNREWITGCDAVVWAINPAVHAIDETTMFQNLQGQAETARTVATFAGNRSLHVSLVHVPPVRNRAAWMAGSIAQLALGGVATITFDTAHEWLREFLAVQPARMIRANSTDRARAIALAVEHAGGVTVWIGNTSDDPIEVAFEGRTLSLAPQELRRVDRKS